MKKIILIAAVFIGMITAAFAQDCKYKTNEVDKTTGKLVKLTKQKMIADIPFKCEADMATQKIADNCNVQFVCALGFAGRDFVVTKGDKLVYSLDNGEEVVLMRGDEKEFYPISIDQMNSLLKSKTNLVTLHFTNSKNGEKSKQVFKIGDKDGDKIQDLIKCIM